jgi:hypothetical protein
MVYYISKHSSGSLKSFEHLEQSILSTGFLATEYFVNTSIINNGKTIAELETILTSDITEQL